ncbi:hypothetical protein ACWELB_34160 [Streptomyces asiaticus]|uniref:hypothetical protein n=1 Tax=Streptomyces asiaticus TaxID=114695 RepID=UPI003D75E7B5
MFLAAPPPPVTVVIDRHDDAIHTHTALAAHLPPSGRITLLPGPGTTSETGLAHDLLAALGKPRLLPGGLPRPSRYPARKADALGFADAHTAPGHPHCPEHWWKVLRDQRTAGRAP